MFVVNNIKSRTTRKSRIKMWEGILTETPHCSVLTRGPSSPMSAWRYHDLDDYCDDDDDDDVVNKGKEDDD